MNSQITISLELIHNHSCLAPVSSLASPILTLSLSIFSLLSVLGSIMETILIRSHVSAAILARHTTHMNPNMFCPCPQILSAAHTHTSTPNSHTANICTIALHFPSITYANEFTTRHKLANIHMQYWTVRTLLNSTKMQVRRNKDRRRFWQQVFVILNRRQMNGRDFSSCCVGLDGSFIERYIQYQQPERLCRLSTRVRWYRQLSCRNSYPYWLQQYPTMGRNPITPPRMTLAHLAGSLPPKYPSTTPTNTTGYTLICTQNPQTTAAQNTLPSSHTIKNIKQHDMDSQLPLTVKYTIIGLSPQHINGAMAALPLNILLISNKHNRSKNAKMYLPRLKWYLLSDMRDARRGVYRQVWREQGELPERRCSLAQLYTLQSMSVRVRCYGDQYTDSQYISTTRITIDKKIIVLGVIQQLWINNLFNIRS